VLGVGGWGLGFGVWGVGSGGWVCDVGCRDLHFFDRLFFERFDECVSGFKVWGLGFMAYGSGFRV